MGWTRLYQKMPLEIEEIEKFFSKEFGLIIRKTELMVRNGREVVVYMVVQTKDDEPLHFKDETFGLVILMKVFKDGKGGGFGYKEIYETSGPFYFDASKELIDMLSPTENETALKWRKSCLEERNLFLDGFKG
jgi:hypothetical protein